MDKCEYEEWVEFPEFYPCDQVKQVPLMIINGKKDNVIFYNGLWEEDDDNEYL